MKAKSRKRLLISSVAMLLVAMLALGTATFAWFTSNPNATASGLSMKATASKGLVIQTATHGAVDPDFWGHTDYLNYDGTTGVSKTASVEANPASFNPDADLTTGYRVEAKADDNYAAADDATVESATANSDYYTENIKCKLTGAADESETGSLKLKSLSISTVPGVDMSSAIRVGIAYNGTVIGVYSPAAATNKVLTKTGVYSEALGSDYTFTAASAVSNINLGSVKQDGSDIVTVVVYLDGEAANVYSQNISVANLISSVNVALIVE